MEPSRPQPPNGASPHGLGHPVAREDFDRGDSVWNRAAARGVQGDPFCCRSEWMFSFHDAMAPRRPLLLRQHEHSAIAFASRVHAQLGFVLEPVESSWLFGCPLLGEHALDLLEQVIADHEQLRLEGEPISVLVSGLLLNTALPRRLLARLHRRFDRYELEPNVMVSASLRGGIDGYLSRRTGRLRRNLRAQRRRAEGDGVHFERHVPTTAAAADRVYERMLAVERRSWKGIGRCGMTEPPSRGFYRVLLRRFAASAIGRVVFARHADQDIGFIFGGVADGTYRGQQFSFVEQWRDASIGNLLQLEQLRWLCEEGAERYDMGPAMEYKTRWTEIETRCACWLLRGRG